MPTRKISKKRKLLSFVTCSCCTRQSMTDSDEDIEPRTSERCIMQDVAVVEEVDASPIAVKETIIKVEGSDNPGGDTLQNKTNAPAENSPRLIGNGEDVINIPEIIISVDVDMLHENEQKDFIESIDGVLPVASGDLTDIPVDVTCADTGQNRVYEEPIKPKYVQRRNSVPHIFSTEADDKTDFDKLEEVEESCALEEREIKEMINHIIEVASSIVSEEEGRSISTDDETQVTERSTSVASEAETIESVNTATGTLTSETEDEFVEDMIGHLLHDVLSSVSQDTTIEAKPSLNGNMSPLRTYYKSTSGSSMIWGCPATDATTGFQAGLHGGMLVPSCSGKKELDVDAVVESGNVCKVSNSVSLEWDTYWVDKDEEESEREEDLSKEEQIEN